MEYGSLYEGLELPASSSGDFILRGFVDETADLQMRFRIWT
jgi:hypothetical protein